MADVKGVNRTLADTPTPANRIPKGEADGRVKVMVDSYEAAAVANGSTIEMGVELPIGAVVLEIILESDNLGNSATLSCGDSTSAARYISATTHGSAATISRLDSIGGRNYTITSTTRQILLTVGTGEITGTIEIVILYAQD